jgi:uncharacterized protein (DUF4415 family)
MKKSKSLTDEEGEVRELLLEDLKKFRPLVEVASPTLLAKLGIPPRESKAPKKERTTLRLSQDVLERFRATGPGWQTRIDAALREWLESHPAE